MDIFSSYCVNFCAILIRKRHCVLRTKDYYTILKDVIEVNPDLYEVTELHSDNTAAADEDSNNTHSNLYTLEYAKGFWIYAQNYMWHYTANIRGLRTES
jgi:hypothetical protein